MNTISTKIRSLKVSLALVACLFLLMGCGVQENFDYTTNDDDLKFSWGHIWGVLDGSESVGFFKVTRGSPYSFWYTIVFDKREHLEGTIRLTEVKVINTRTDKLLAELDSPIEKPIETVYDYDTVWSDEKYDYVHINKPEPIGHKTVFRIDNILRFEDQEAEYEDLILKMKFIVKEGGKASEYSAEIPVKKRYSKQFSSIFD